jgi:GAF domain-containing protein
VELPDDLRLAVALTDLAMEILRDSTFKGDLDRLSRMACHLIPTCSGASISMMVEGEPTTVATTDRLSLELDMVQYDNNEGPCVTALGGEWVRIAYLRADDRFPHFAVGAADRRVRSVLSTPVIDHGTVLGSLNLYSQVANGFDKTAEDAAVVVAAEVAHAFIKSTVLGTARTTAERLQEQHDESILVSRAQGLLMALQDCSSAQAADLIRRAADDNGERLITTAERILSTIRQEPVPSVSGITEGAAETAPSAPVDEAE